MLFYVIYWIIRKLFVTLQPKAASTGYASAIQVNLIALGLHRPCPREQKVIVMEATVFNPLQIHLLQMFALDKSQNGLDELKDVLYRHYSAKMEDRLDTLWQSGKLNQERLDEINEMDLHKLK